MHKVLQDLLDFVFCLSILRPFAKITSLRKLVSAKRLLFVSIELECQVIKV
jgi:hypothetical protein